MIQEALQEFGLSSKEITIYITVLRLGQSVAGEISRKANIQRELVYIILKRLEKKGVMSHTIKNRTKHFEAADPQLLLKKLQHKEMLFKESLSELEELRKKTFARKPHIEIFDGIEGIRSVLNEITRYYEQNNKEKTLFGYGSAGKFEKFLRWELPHFIERRVKSKVKFYGIYNRTKEGISKKKLPLSDIRLIPNEFESSTFNLLYPNHVATIIFTEEPIAMIITSKEVYESYKGYFNVLWKHARQ